MVFSSSPEPIRSGMSGPPIIRAGGAALGIMCTGPMTREEFSRTASTAPETRLGAIW